VGFTLSRLNPALSVWVLHFDCWVLHGGIWGLLMIVEVLHGGIWVFIWLLDFFRRALRLGAEVWYNIYLIRWRLGQLVCIWRMGKNFFNQGSKGVLRTAEACLLSGIRELGGGPV